MADKIGTLLRKLRNRAERRRAERKLEAAVYSIDTCGEITGYPCNWLITGPEAFEKHLKREHPEGEHR